MTAPGLARRPPRVGERERPLTVVVVHEHYREPGGEDRVFDAEVALLLERGHRVSTFTADNRDLHRIGTARAAADALWNPGAARALAALVRRERADVVHFHNTFPLLSASVYRAAKRAGAAVVQTLHNFRLVCPNGLLYGEGAPCERCVGLSVPWPAIARGCYRGSRAATAAAAASAAVHRRAGARHVDLYLALSEHSRDKFVASGLPAERIAVRPNFLPDDPGEGAHAGGYALFVGRLSEEKGVRTLLDAWGRLGGRMPLVVAGSGPLESELRGMGIEGVEWRGGLPRAEVLRLMRDARLLVFPSECYENFPLAPLEAFATGLPVLAADGGAAAEIVRRHDAGLLFRRGDAEALARTVGIALDHPDALNGIGRRARAAFLAHYTAERGYASLLEAYDRALRRRPLGSRRDAEATEN